MFDEWMWGMHGGWWVFWILIIIVVAVFLIRMEANPFLSKARQTPLDILQHRYASGEISTDEYEENKARLQRDRQ